METNFKKVTKGGSVTLPVSLRRELTIEAGDGVEITNTEQGIMIKAHVPRCSFCKSTENVSMHMGKGICTTCFHIIKESVGEKGE